MCNAPEVLELVQHIKRRPSSVSLCNTLKATLNFEHYLKHEGCL